MNPSLSVHPCVCLHIRSLQLSELNLEGIFCWTRGSRNFHFILKPAPYLVINAVGFVSPVPIVRLLASRVYASVNFLLVKMLCEDISKLVLAGHFLSSIQWYWKHLILYINSGRKGENNFAVYFLENNVAVYAFTAPTRFWTPKALPKQSLKVVKKIMWYNCLQIPLRMSVSKRNGNSRRCHSTFSNRSLLQVRPLVASPPRALWKASWWWFEFMGTLCMGMLI